MSTTAVEPDELAKVNEILRRRAERLRRAGGRDETSSFVEQIAVLEVGDEQVGVPVSRLRELVRCPPMSRLPGLPAWIPGIVQIRGELISALDLASLLQIEATGSPERLAVVEGPRGPLGLLAHRVLGFRELAEGDLAQDYVGRGETTQRLLSGMTNDLVAILDVARLVADEQIVVRAA